MKTYFLLILLIFSGGLIASSSNSTNNNNNNNNSRVEGHFRTALNIIHSHIAALKRTRDGNPVHRQAALITDYQTVSAIIQSMPYYLPTDHALARLHDYRPIVTHYRNETTLDASQNFAFNKINAGIFLLPQNIHTRPLIGNLRQTIDLSRRDFDNHAVDARHREEVAQHRKSAQEYITYLHYLDASNDLDAAYFSEETPTTSSSSSTTTLDDFLKPISEKEAEKQQKKLFEDEETKASTQKIAQALKKRPRESCKGPMDAFVIRKNHDKDDDDDKNSGKRQKNFSNSTTHINNSIIFINQKNDFKQ